MKESQILRIASAIGERNKAQAKIERMMGNGLSVSHRVKAGPVQKRAKHKGRAIQALYMTALRPLTKKQRVSVKKIKLADGYQKAIAAAKKLSASA